MKKKVYLILGASSDLGMELVSQLNEEIEDSVFILHYNSDKSKLETVHQLNGNKFIFLQCDLLSTEEVDDFILKISEFTDAPSHIVHMAATPFAYMHLKDFNYKKFIDEINLQITSFIKILQTFLPKMAKRKQNNKVVIMTSYVCYKPQKFMMEYIIVKYAMLGLMKSLAADYVGKKLNINGVAPSMIETKFLRNIDDRIIQMNADASPENRNATVGDVVPAIKFLLSDEANYMHGVNLDVSNGLNI